MNLDLLWTNQLEMCRGFRLTWALSVKRFTNNFASKIVFEFNGICSSCPSYFTWNYTKWSSTGIDYGAVEICQNQDYWYIHLEWLSTRVNLELLEFALRLYADIIQLIPGFYKLFRWIGAVESRIGAEAQSPHLTGLFRWWCRLSCNHGHIG